VSERFLEALRGPHEATTRVDVFYAGILVEADLRVESGSVTIDEGSQVRRSAQLTISDPALDPAGVIDLLAPFGTELLIRRGITFGEGDEELIPLGVFRVDEAGRSGWNEGVTVQASDRSNAVAEARFLKPWNTPANSTVTAEVERIVRDVFPNVEFYSLIDDDAPTTAGTWERDRWEAIDRLSTAIGAELVFDPLGRAVLRDVPTTADEPVWTVDAGERGVMIDVSTGISRADVFNAVAAIGESTEGAPAIVGYAYVSTGPLTWAGPFGKKPRFFTSQYITTVNQAQRAARGILARSTGFARTVNPTSIVNPALDAGDTINIVLPDGLVYKHVIRALTVPLGPAEALPITTRVVDQGSIALEGTLD
jgi:hypothetical protein